jgi:hypothetical protein
LHSPSKTPHLGKNKKYTKKGVALEGTGLIDAYWTDLLIDGSILLREGSPDQFVGGIPLL